MDANTISRGTVFKANRNLPTESWWVGKRGEDFSRECARQQERIQLSTLGRANQLTMGPTICRKKPDEPNENSKTRSHSEETTEARRT